MNEDEILQMLTEHFQREFPRPCPVCHRRFASLLEYIRDTKPLGRPVSYDADAGDWDPKGLVGTVTLSNCTCGTTIALGLEKLSLESYLELLNWIKTETERRKIPPSDLLHQVRVEIRKRVLIQGE